MKSYFFVMMDQGELDTLFNALTMFDYKWMELAELGIFGTQNQHIGKNYHHYQKDIEMSELISGKEAFVYGNGINDFNGNISIKGKHILEYTLWKAMLRRCYSEDLMSSRPA